MMLMMYYPIFYVKALQHNRIYADVLLFSYPVIAWIIRNSLNYIYIKFKIYIECFGDI